MEGAGVTAASIRRRAIADHDLPGDLHPLLQRLYASRGVRSDEELQLGLDQLIPVRQLDGVAGCRSALAHRSAAAASW